MVLLPLVACDPVINLDPLPLELVTRRAHVKARDEQPSEWKRPIYGDRRQVVWLPPMTGWHKLTIHPIKLLHHSPNVGCHF